MKSLLANKLVLIIAALVVAAGGYAIYNSISDSTSDTTPTSRQTAHVDEDENSDDYDLSVTPESLRNDLPLYPGVKHEPLPMMGGGYYRWNFEAPESDRGVIADDITKLANAKGWETISSHVGSATHELAFTKDGDTLTVVVRADGADKRPVYYEFMTKAFKEQNNIGN